MKTIKIFNQTWQKLQSFRTKYKKIIEEYEQLEKEYQTILTEVVNEAKRLKKDYEDSSWRITYIEPYRRYYDYQTLIELATPAEKSLIDRECREIIVNAEKLQNLINKGVLSLSLAQAAYREEKMPPRVMIINKNEKSNSKKS